MTPRPPAAGLRLRTGPDTKRRIDTPSPLSAGVGGSSLVPFFLRGKNKKKKIGSCFSFPAVSTVKFTMLGELG
jgi:hypothetical protein